MLKVAILIAASPNSAFFSQIAAMNYALRKLRWTRWQPTVYAYFGGEHDADALRAWRPHLRDVEMVCVSENHFEREGIWAQCDAIFQLAPRDADVILTMDADTLPVADLEELLDRVVAKSVIAGVIAHYPFPRHEGMSASEAWANLAEGIIESPLDFAFLHTMVNPEASDESSRTPFYVNFGVVFFSRDAFDAIASKYLSIRPLLATRMRDPWFSGQAALTLAITAAKVETWALPMRYNFPNDVEAEKRYPNELEQVVVFHYLRTQNFDRHKIFTSPAEYSEFLNLSLAGADKAFQEAVRHRFGSEYPFA